LQTGLGMKHYASSSSDIDMEKPSYLASMREDKPLLPSKKQRNASKGCLFSPVKLLVATALLLCLLYFFAFPSPSSSPLSTSTITSSYNQFIKVKGTHFFKDCRPFKIAGFNVENLAEAGNPTISRDLAINEGSSGHNKLRTLLQNAAASGFNVVRTWAHTTDPTHPLQISPGPYDEAAFQGLDQVIHQAKEAGMHVILSFTDNWKYHGGVDQFVDWSSTAPPRDVARFSIDGDASLMAAGDVDLNQQSEERRVYESTRKVLFYTDPGAKQLYVSHMKTILERENSITGVRYADDNTIMSFNLINELRCEGCSQNEVHNWITEMARTFKQLDSNHLLTIGGEGFYKSGDEHSNYNPGAAEESDWAGKTGQDFIRDHAISDIDYATLHLWAKNWAADAGDSEEVDAFRRDWINVHVEDAANVLYKPLVLEEFGMRIITGSQEGNSASSSPSLEQQLQQRDAVFQPLLAEIQRHMSQSEGEENEEESPSPLAGSLFWKHAFPIYKDSASQDEYGVHPDDATYHLLTEHAGWVNSHMNRKVPRVSNNDECVEEGRVCWVPTTSWAGLVRTCGQQKCVVEEEKDGAGVFLSKEMCCRAGLGGWGSEGCGMSWFF